MNSINIKDNFVQKLSTIHLPVELFNIMLKWDFIIKSPYGHSYYSAPVDWEYKEHGSFRISDHWNFSSHGKLHCCTISDVENDTHWTLAQYDSNSNLWIPILSLPRTKMPISYTDEYKLQFILMKHKHLLEKLNSDNTMDSELKKRIKSDFELRNMPKYFNLLNKLKI
jgi:hypothetical protein